MGFTVDGNLEYHERTFFKYLNCIVRYIEYVRHRPLGPIFRFIVASHMFP